MDSRPEHSGGVRMAAGQSRIEESVMEDHFSMMGLWSSMGPVGKGVVIFLFGMSIYSVSVVFEKYFLYRAAVKQSIEYLPVVTKCLKENALKKAVEEAKKHPKGHLSRVMSAGLQEFLNQQDTNVAYDIIGAVNRAQEREVALVMAEMKSKLAGLGTIGATAPFVGLFGTVAGIINAFRGMAATGSGGLGAVSAGIAEALVTTAIGLFVAIPAVWLFNYFTGKVERFQVEMGNSSSELVDFFLKMHGSTVGVGQRAAGAH
jgi:biopolymer transport protein ExbB/biopolymer transport protein TolQ